MGKRKGLIWEGKEEGVREINLWFVAANQKPLWVVQTAVQADNAPRTRECKFMMLGSSFNTSTWQGALKSEKLCSYLPRGNLLLRGEIMQTGERGGEENKIKLDTKIKHTKVKYSNGTDEQMRISLASGRLLLIDMYISYTLTKYMLGGESKHYTHMIMHHSLKYSTVSMSYWVISRLRGTNGNSCRK